MQKEMAAQLGFAKVSQHKGAVARAIKDYVERGGFMFAMCSATDTYDIALAAEGVDIADAVYDGDPPDPQAAAEARLLAHARVPGLPPRDEPARSTSSPTST